MYPSHLRCNHSGFDVAPHISGAVPQALMYPSVPSAAPQVLVHSLSSGSLSLGPCHIANLCCSSFGFFGQALWLSFIPSWPRSQGCSQGVLVRLSQTSLSARLGAGLWMRICALGHLSSWRCQAAGPWLTTKIFFHDLKAITKPNVSYTANCLAATSLLVLHLVLPGAAVLIVAS